jgi:hypothetical protein
MCLGGSRPAPPPAPPPPTPPPPRASKGQASPRPATATGRDRSSTENIENVRKGRKVLRIPLLPGYGTGVQISN